jgi:hypothetical protein
MAKNACPECGVDPNELTDEIDRLRKLCDDGGEHAVRLLKERDALQARVQELERRIADALEYLEHPDTPLVPAANQTRGSDFSAAPPGSPGEPHGSAK